MEVDTVIATHELIELFDKMKTDFNQTKLSSDEEMNVDSNHNEE